MGHSFHEEGVGEVNPTTIVCWQCGATPAVRRPLSDNSGFTPATCFQCLWEGAESARRRLEELSGLRYGDDTVPLGPDASEAEIDAEWVRTDAIDRLLNSLNFIYLKVRSGEDINMVWTDGRVDEPQTESNVRLLHVRSLLARYGYEETSVVTTRTDDPALTSGVLLPAGEPSHWTTHIKFHLVRERENG